MYNISSAEPYYVEGTKNPIMSLFSSANWQLLPLCKEAKFCSVVYIHIFLLTNDCYFHITNIEVLTRNRKRIVTHLKNTAGPENLSPEILLETRSLTSYNISTLKGNKTKEKKKPAILKLYNSNRGRTGNVDQMVGFFTCCKKSCPFLLI